MSSVKKSHGRPTYWRSLGELEGDPEFQKYLESEFPQPAEELELGSKPRRRFMQVMGASFALAGASGCRWQEDKILPYSRRPDGVVPGVPRFFNTAMDFQGAGFGLRVRSYEGRPIKIEGNPNHSDSGGAAGVYQQAALLEMYDPDRSQVVLNQGKASTTEAFTAFISQHTKALQASGGSGLRVVAGAGSSPTIETLRQRLLATYPNAKWVEYEPLGAFNAAAGARVAFGDPYRVLHHLGKARVIVCLEADLLGDGPAAVRAARGFAQGREPEPGKLSRLYSAESTLSRTGSVSDHRLPLRSTFIKALAAALDAELGVRLKPGSEFGPSQQRPAARFLEDAEVQKFLAAVVDDLVANRGRSVVAVGEHQPPEVHALVCRINDVLGNVGTTVTYVPWTNAPSQQDGVALAELVKEMEGGQVSTLVVLDSNPTYNAPADVPFAAALGKVETSIHLGLYADETGRRASWHVPMAHFLESWGDARATDGTVSIVQPLIAPLYGGKSAAEMLATLTRRRSDGLSLVQETHGQRIADDRMWRKVVHDGVVPGSALTPVRPELRSVPPFSFEEGELGSTNPASGSLELRLIADSKVYDGRFANNGWLQELPDPVTKLTWDNAALFSPKTARSLGIEEGDIVDLEVDGRKLSVPALMAPGQAADSVALALGYGRTAAGRVGGDDAHPDEGKVPAVGVNAYLLRSVAGWFFASGLSVKATGRSADLATTQEKHAIDTKGAEQIQARLPQLVREANLDEYKKHPDFAKHRVHHMPLLSLWEEPVQYEGYKWGMSIDLNKCIGCNACMVACQAENNIPVVGKERVLMGREMHWIRIDRYYKGDPERPEVRHQPVTCQQCEHAPCEQVCPVGATSHSSEGLNDMAYNRCIGTRYCSNNCPYKVRRFNYFNFHEDMKNPRNEVKGMVFNPEVTVRFRGVMEKCTYCVQRIQNAKIVAKNDRRKLKDGEIVTACQETCPTGAITFGDLNDPNSKVKQLQQLPRSYTLLTELNVRPRTQYLAAVTNPHPELTQHETDGNDH